MERRKKSTQVKREATVAILASECLAQVAVSCQHARRSSVSQCTSFVLNDTLAKLFEGLLISRLTTHTELNNTLTHNQLGTKPNTQYAHPPSPRSSHLP